MIMARFIGYIKGQKGEASRLGSANSGFRATVNGWNSGIEVRAYVDSNGEDVFNIYKTGGTNKDYSTLIASVNSKEAKLQDVLGVYHHA
jgi:hypothetical protein